MNKKEFNTLQPCDPNNSITLRVKNLLGKRAKYFNIESGDPLHSDYFWLSKKGSKQNEIQYTMYEFERVVKNIFGVPKQLMISKLLGK